jgi:hypothetical protein
MSVIFGLDTQLDTTTAGSEFILAPGHGVTSYSKTVTLTDVDYIGIVGTGTIAATVGGSPVTLVKNDRVHFGTFAPKTGSNAISVTSTGGVIQHVSVGKMTSFPARVTSSFVMPKYSGSITSRTNKTIGGYYLGRIYEDNGCSFSLPLSYFNQTQLSTFWSAFEPIAKVRPFFLQWDPICHDSDVAFVWLQDDLPKPTQLDYLYMEMSLDVNGVI